jgi:hypothetical protein
VLSTPGSVGRESAKVVTQFVFCRIEKESSIPFGDAWAPRVATHKNRKSKKEYRRYFFTSAKVSQMSLKELL